MHNSTLETLLIIVSILVFFLSIANILNYGSSRKAIDNCRFLFIMSSNCVLGSVRKYVDFFHDIKALYMLAQNFFSEKENYIALQVYQLK